MNYPAASSGVLPARCHAGPDPASSLEHSLDTGVRRYDGYAANCGVLDPKRINEGGTPFERMGREVLEDFVAYHLAIEFKSYRLLKSITG
jgi:hypothetical protein